MGFKATPSMTVTHIFTGIIGAVALSHEETADCAAMVGRRAEEMAACVPAHLAVSVTVVMREEAPHAEDPVWAPAVVCAAVVGVVCVVAAEAVCVAVEADIANLCDGLRDIQLGSGSVRVYLNGDKHDVFKEDQS